MKRSYSDVLLDSATYIILFLISITMIYPFMNVLAVSVSSYDSYLQDPLRIIPGQLDFSAFKYVFSNQLILSSYKNTIIITVVGTLLDLILIVMTAYPLSRRYLRGRSLITSLIVFTMMFGGGLIPNFLLVKNLGMVDTLWALIVPTLISAYNLILVKSFFENIPDSLDEAARIDGANDMQILWKVFIPLSAPIMATMALFTAVRFWNSFFNAIVYIRSPDKWTLQLVLREIIMQSNVQLMQSSGNMAEMSNIPTKTLQYATLIVVILPILTVYPFLQKYFVKGIMIGAVKG